MKSILIIFAFMVKMFSFDFDTVFLWRTSMVGVVVTSYGANVFDAKEGSIEYLLGDRASAFKGNVVFDWQPSIAKIGNFSLNLYKVYGIGKWQKNGNSDDEFSNNHFDANAMYRLENRYLGLEYSLGLSLMSNVSLDRDIDGGWLYFNHGLGAVVKVADFSFFAKFAHYSNNGIFHPNFNSNFFNFGAGWRY